MRGKRWGESVVINDRNESEYFVLGWGLKRGDEVLQP
jgi:hypothetical protein